MLMALLSIKGVDLFKRAGRSISGWIPSLKTGTTIRQPFCSQIEERFLLCQVRDRVTPQITLERAGQSW